MIFILIPFLDVCSSVLLQVNDACVSYYLIIPVDFLCIQLLHFLWLWNITYHHFSLYNYKDLFEYKCDNFINSNTLTMVGVFSRCFIFFTFCDVHESLFCSKSTFYIVFLSDCCIFRWSYKSLWAYGSFGFEELATSGDQSSNLFSNFLIFFGCRSYCWNNLLLCNCPLGTPNKNGTYSCVILQSEERYLVILLVRLQSIEFLLL